jgi:probable HAF family extracellular repeat protein
VRSLSWWKHLVSKYDRPSCRSIPHGTSRNRLRLEWLEDRALPSASLYTLRDLGNLPGGAQISVAYAVNNSGQVAGYSEFGYGQRAFLWDPVTGMRNLNTLPGASDSVGRGINSLGQVVGESGGPGFPNEWHPYLWDPSTGAMQDLGQLGSGNRHAAVGINDAGQVVGYSTSRAYIWDSVHGMQDLGFLRDDNFAVANAINNAGKVVGISQIGGAETRHAVLWEAPGVMQDLGDLPGGAVFSEPIGVSDSGAVGGYSYAATGRRAFLWDSSTGMRDLGDLPGGADESYAKGVSDAGQVVGYSLATGGQRAFLWDQAHGMRDLNDLVDLQSGWTLRDASAISGSGYIVGQAVAANGSIHAFLLTPVQQNTSPTISAIPDQAAEENILTAAIGFTVGDAETPAESLVVTATSSDQSLIPDAKIRLGGSESSRTVTITPAKSSGLATITLKVTDPDGASVTTKLTIMVGDSLFEKVAREYAYASHSDQDLLGFGYSVDAVFTDAGTGFYALGLKSSDGHYILGFRGTDSFLDPGDILTDADPRGVGFDQFAANRLAVEQWMDQVGASGERVSLTGHSLGGALAQWFAVDYTSQGKQVGKVVTFNSPGISRESANRFRPDLSVGDGATHYVTNGDVASLAGEAFLAGHYILESFPSVGPLNTLQFIRDKHLLPMLLPEVNTTTPGKPLVRRDPVAHSEPLSVDSLNSPMFAFSGADYYVMLTAVERAVTSDPVLLSLAYIPPALIFRGTTEPLRESFGIGLGVGQAFGQLLLPTDSTNHSLSLPAVGAPFDVASDIGLHLLCAAANDLKRIAWSATKITAGLAGGNYSDVVAALPPWLTLNLIGHLGSLVTGGSPALTVSSGTVLATGITFATATDSPTVLVTGGHLVLRDDTIEESTTGAYAAVEIRGGTADLGTADSPGGNLLSVNGAGELSRSAAPDLVTAVGNTFTLSGIVLPASSLSFTSITSPITSASFGQAVALLASVRPDASSGSASPTGTVDFFDETTNTNLGTVHFTTGVVVLNLSTLGVGGHQILAMYSGDVRFAPSRDPIGLQVSPDGSITDLIPRVSTPLPGQDVAFTARVSANSPGGGTPTGIVEFRDETAGRSLDTVALMEGTAKITISDLLIGGHRITAAYLGDGNYLPSTGTSDVTVIPPASLSGIVFEDFNGDGLVDFGEAGIAGVRVILTGTDDLGAAVAIPLRTDRDGIYVYTGLRPGNYSLAEEQPAGYVQGVNAVGTTGGSVVGDRFSVNLAVASNGLNYNYGERPAAGSVLHRGLTAGIGFWNNRNGQVLIRSLNGGSASTRLGDWLGITFPNMFGVRAAASDLRGRTNDYIALFFQSRFVSKGQKLNAQVLATALAIYVTNATLDDTGIGRQYGFVLTDYGAGTATWNVGSGGPAFGVANSARLTLLDLLLATDARAVNGLLYNGDGRMSTLSNDVFSGINSAGDIS